jgi:hypothetical protein
MRAHTAQELRSEHRTLARFECTIEPHVPVLPEQRAPQTHPIRLHFELHVAHLTSHVGDLHLFFLFALHLLMYGVRCISSYVARRSAHSA